MEVICNIDTLGDREVDEREKNIYCQMITCLYNQICQEIDLSLLRQIIIPEDYREGLFKFQRKNGHNEFVTNNDYALGCAQVVSSLEGEEEVYNIVIDKKIVLGLLPDNVWDSFMGSMKEDERQLLSQVRNCSVNIFFHECGHVYEGSLRKNIKWLQSWKESSDLQSQYIQLSISIWQEYFASRVASSSFVPYREMIDDMYDTCNKVEKMILEKRKQYNLGNMALDEFCRIFNSYIEFLLKQLGTAHGNFWIFGKENRQEVVNIIQRGFYSTNAENIWKELGEVLDKLYDTFPAWSGLEVFDELISVIIKYIERFEVYITQKPEGIYYEIPVKLW